MFAIAAAGESTALFIVGRLGVGVAAQHLFPGIASSLWLFLANGGLSYSLGGVYVGDFWVNFGCFYTGYVRICPPFDAFDPFVVGRKVLFFVPFRLRMGFSPSQTMI